MDLVMAFRYIAEKHASTIFLGYRWGWAALIVVLGNQSSAEFPGCVGTSEMTACLLRTGRRCSSTLVPTSLPVSPMFWAFH